MTELYQPAPKGMTEQDKLYRDEIKRLKALNTSLVAALEDLLAFAESDESGRIHGASLDGARAAISKATTK